MEPALQLQAQQLVDFLSVQHPTDILTLAHQRAAQLFRNIKKRKQAELQPKVDQAIASKDKHMIKKQKKDNDNHARSVATLGKYRFIEKELDQLCRMFMLVSAEIGAGYTDMNKQIEALRKENERLERQLSSVACRNDVPKTSLGRTAACNITYNNQTQHVRPSSECKRAPCDDVASTTTRDASYKPVHLPNPVLFERARVDTSQQVKTSSQSSTMLKRAAFSAEVNDAKSLDTSVPNHIKTSGTEISGTLLAYAHDQDTLLSSTPSCTRHDAVPIAAMLQSMPDDRLQNDSVKTSPNHLSPSITPVTSCRSLAVSAANKLSSSGLRCDHNAMYASYNDRNSNLTSAQLLKNDSFEHTPADHCGSPVEKHGLTVDEFFIELDTQELLRKCKLASDKYALGA